MISMRATATNVALGVLALVCLGVGIASGQTSNNVIFKSNLDDYSGYSDCWGYTAPNGDEYALLGTTTGLSVVNLVDPENPYETGFFSGATSTWRDIKTYGDVAYVVNESSGGLMIVDLSDPENPAQLPTYNGFSTAHNLYIDEPTARAFIAGSNLSAGGCRILSLASPASPTEIGSWEGEYFHDIMVQDNRLYGSAIYNARLRILDVTNVGSITILGTISGYPNAFTHNAWPTADGNYVMTSDETSGSSCRLWDISNLPTATQTDLYQPNAVTIPHNTHIDGDLAIISYYTLGVRIVDISNPFDIQEVGFYDTWPANNAGSFDGCWGAFPFFGTNEHLIVASDLSTGLYVLEYRGPLGTVAGEVTETGSPSTKIEGARLEVLQTGSSTTTNAAGQYTLQDTAGSVDVEVSAYGYVTTSVPVTIIEGSTVSLDVTLDPVPSGILSGTVTDASTALPLPGATIEILGTPLVETSDASGDYGPTQVPVGVYPVRARAFGYNAAEGIVHITDGGATVLDFPLNQAAFAADFESDPGWTVTGNASTGQWERADPQPTNGGQTQTGDDHTPSPGVNAWITGPLAGGSVGDHDVDNGATILTTSTFDVSGVVDPRASYWRWYVSGYSTNPTTDMWVVEISSNGGSSWTAVVRAGRRWSAPIRRFRRG
jgi:choice-of-anchor B domain-containing protein